MSSVCGEYDDAECDDSLFPAYTDYINGTDTRYSEGHAFNLHPLPHPELGPIPYTNSMPSRHLSMEPMAAIPVGFGVPTSPAVLELRSPCAYPDLVKLIPPETLHYAPPPPRKPAYFAPSAVKQEPPMTSAEITRRKLLGASLQHFTGPPVQSPLQQFPRKHAEHALHDTSPQNRRMSARQATHPSLLRSSSTTDIDSQAGTMPPTRPRMLYSAHSPTPAGANIPSAVQQPLQQSFGRQPSPVSRGPGPLGPPHGPRFSSTPLIRPGELLDDPRYATTPMSHRQRLNAQITELYDIAQHHPDPESRKQALAHIATRSAQVYRTTQEREQTLQRRQMEDAAQRQVQADLHKLHARSPEMDNSRTEPQGFPEDYEQPMLSPQHQPYAFPQHYKQQMMEHTLIHQQPRQLPLQQYSEPYGHLQPQTPTLAHKDLRTLVDAQVPKFLVANRLINTSGTDAKGLADRAGAMNWQNSFRASLPPEGLRYLDEAVARMSARHSLSSHQPVQQHQPVQDYQPPHPPSLDQSHQQPYPSNETPQPQLPIIPVSEPLREHIHANLRLLFSAMRASSMPPTPNNAELQQQAQDFQRDFKATLPPEGHAYIAEIVNNMSIARAEGRDIMSVMPV